MTSNYFNSHTIKFTRYNNVISMAYLREVACTCEQWESI